MAELDESLARLERAIVGAIPSVVVASSDDPDAPALEIASSTDPRRGLRVTTQDPDAERYDYIGFVPDGASGRRPIGWGKNITPEQLLEVVRRYGG